MCQLLLQKVVPLQVQKNQGKLKCQIFRGNLITLYVTCPASHDLRFCISGPHFTNWPCIHTSLKLCDSTKQDFSHAFLEIKASLQAITKGLCLSQVAMNYMLPPCSISASFYRTSIQQAVTSLYCCTHNSLHVLRTRIILPITKKALPFHRIFSWATSHKIFDTELPRFSRDYPCSTKLPLTACDCMCTHTQAVSIQVSTYTQYLRICVSHTHIYTSTHTHIILSKKGGNKVKWKHSRPQCIHIQSKETLARLP